MISTDAVEAADQFRNAIAAAGLTPPAELIPDGRLHRFATNGRANDDAGWYVFHTDGIPTGRFGCWRTGIDQPWEANIGRGLSRGEKAAHRARLAEIRQARGVEKAQLHAEARGRATAIWNAAGPAGDDHPYIRRKGVRAFGLRVGSDRRLVVPMRIGDELHSLQFIDAAGDKQFLYGGRVKGCCHVIGTLAGAAALCITEGYATGATIFAATRYPVVVAFNSGNLIAVAKVIRARYPGLRLILCADDDVNTPGNPGLAKGTEAAKAVSGWLAVPHFGTDRPVGATDFNDLMQHRGVEAVRKMIMHARPIHDADRGNPWAYAQTAAELLGEPDSTVVFVDEHGILAPGCITELFSPRGLGKTHVAWALAVSAARARKRVLYIDRDNSRREVKRRLRAWGGDRVTTLKVITREKAPSLTDTSAWAVFPIADYDVVILDSFDAAAEGVGEQDSTKPSRAIAAILNVARATDGPAVLVLGNVIKSGAHSRGSGVIEDRADIVFEVRDATDLKPSGSKEWWEELPPAGAEAWAQRSTRRKRRDRYQLALVPSKYRVGEEPDPFALEIDLSSEPWQLRNVTTELIASGDATREAAAKQKQDTETAAIEALMAEVERRYAAGDPMLMSADAIPLLQRLRIGRDAARVLIRAHVGVRWTLEPATARKGAPVRLLPAAGTADRREWSVGTDPFGNPCGTSISAHPIPAGLVPSGPQQSTSREPGPDANFPEGEFLRRTEPATAEIETGMI